jgi:hypothetical protein
MTVFWDVEPCQFLPDYTAQHPRRQPSSKYYLVFSWHEHFIEIIGDHQRGFHRNELPVHQTTKKKIMNHWALYLTSY